MSASSEETENQEAEGSENLRSAAPVSPMPTSIHAPESQNQNHVTSRAVVLGALLIPFNAFWIVRQERVLFGPYPSTLSLFANVIFLLFVMVGINAVWRRVAPRTAFSQGELLTLYTMLAISTGLAGLDGVGILSQMMPHGAWFGKANQWTGFLPAFPRWLVVADREVVRGHYLGASSFYRPAILYAWAVPMFAWTGFITLLLWTANCINVLVRRQWADQERLTFPITWLPLEMTESGPRAALFRNPLMWAGFLVAASLSLWNGIAFLYPSVPALPLGIIDLKPYMTVKPWSAIDWFPITLYPLAIGLGFLLPLDLLFSCWFFYLFWNAQTVATNLFGWDSTPDFPFIKEQGFGSLIGLFFFYLYTGRRTYAAIGRGALRSLQGRGRSAGSNGEALSDGAALLGLAAGLMGLVAFCTAAGVALKISLVFFAIYLATITVITRIRAELGSPVHDFHFMGPDAMLPRALSAGGLHQPDMAFFTFGYALTRAHRSDTMPVGLEGLQMAHLRGMEQRRMLGAILLATVLGTLSAFWAFEHQAYQLGAGAKFNQGIGHAQEAFDRMSGWIGGTKDAHANGPAAGAMGVGLLTTLLLLWLRTQYVGFPLHPIGYAVASSWAIHLVWMPLLLAWLFKTFTIRYGGLGAYRRFLPFALGLILGDCVMGNVWALLSLVLNAPTYNYFGA